MIFQNFGFNQNYPPAAPASQWTPAQLTGLKYYFTAGAGLTLVGDRVSSWTDQVNSVVLTATVSSSAYWPKYISSDSSVNNKPSLYFNSGSETTNRLQNLITSSGVSTTDDFTVIGIIAPVTNSVGGFQVYGGIGTSAAAPNNYEQVMETNIPGVNNTFITYVFSGGSATNPSSGVAINNGVANYHIVAYDSSAGTVYQYANSTTAATTTTGRAVNPTKSALKIIAGDYSDGSNIGGIPYRNGKIMELIYLTSIPSAQELSDLNDYVNNYY